MDPPAQDATQAFLDTTNMQPKKLGPNKFQVELQELQKKHETLQRHSDEKDMKINLMKLNVDNLQTQLQRKNDQVGSLQTAVTELQQKLEAAASASPAAPTVDASEHEKALAETRAECDKLVENIRQDMSALQAKYADLKRRNSELVETHSSKLRELETRARDNASLRQQLDTEQQKSSKYADEVSSLRGHIEEYVQRINALEDTVSSRDGELKSINARLAQSSKEYKDLYVRAAHASPATAQTGSATEPMPTAPMHGTSAVRFNRTNRAVRGLRTSTRT